jgi:MoxR-like ATPase
MASPIVAPRTGCGKERAQRRYVTCKYCKAPGLAWHRCENTRDQAGRQAWRLFIGHKTSSGILADTQQPHACPAGMHEEPTQEPEPEETPDTTAYPHRMDEARGLCLDCGRTPAEIAFSGAGCHVKAAQSKEEPTTTTPEPKRIPKPQAPPAAPGSLEAIIAAAVAPYVKAADPEAIEALVNEKLKTFHDTITQAVGVAVKNGLEVDAEKVQKIATDAALAVVNKEPEPRSITVTAIRDNGTTANLGTAHEQLEQLVYLCRVAPKAMRWPLLYGAPGGGKSHAAAQAALALEVPFYYVALTPGLPDSRLFGYLDANGTYRGTVLRQAYENGGVLCLDEIDNASDTTVTGLNALMANGHGSFPDGIIARHPRFVLVATANTPLRGGSRNHSGRRALDGATLDRFAFLEWHYDTALEDARVQAVLPGKDGKAWVRWVRKVREYAQAHVPQLIVSQRAAYSGAVALAEGLPEGLTLDWLARTYVFAGIEPATVATILAACPLPEPTTAAA